MYFSETANRILKTERLKMALRNSIEEILNEDITIFTEMGKITTRSGKSYFLKSGTPSPIYNCEFNGLKELAKADTSLVVKPIVANEEFILTEFIEEAAPQFNFYATFGRKLAELHRFQSDKYGFYENNYIGVTPQMNIPTEAESKDWVSFYFNKRLLYQYKRAEQNHLVTKEMKRCFLNLERIIDPLLSDAIEPPCLIHGDLWAGNFVAAQPNRPVLIDPAVYYGHREAELAMTRLFGGFSEDFYTSYQKEYPLAPGWEQREDLYKLYHILNHLNIFGSGYLAAAEAIIRKFGCPTEAEFIVSKRQ